MILYWEMPSALYAREGSREGEYAQTCANMRSTYTACTRGNHTVGLHYVVHPDAYGVNPAITHTYGDWCWHRPIYNFCVPPATDSTRIALGRRGFARLPLLAAVAAVAAVPVNDSLLSSHYYMTVSFAVLFACPLLAVSHPLSRTLPASQTSR